MPKRKLREQMLALRRRLAEPEIAEASRSIREMFLGLDVYRRARSLALYAPVHNEIGTDALMRQALLDGKDVFFPKVVGERLEFLRVACDADLAPGTFGIPEPVPGCCPVPVESIDLFVIPGVAFDRSGRRIGFGRGFYDRTIHCIEGKGRIVAFAYDFQIVDDIAAEPHDVRVDAIITETGVVNPPGLTIHKGEEDDDGN